MARHSTLGTPVPARPSARWESRAAKRCGWTTRNAPTWLPTIFPRATGAFDTRTPGLTDGGDLDRGDISSGIDYLSETRIAVARFGGLVATRAAWQRLEAVAKEVGCRAVEGVLLDVRNSTFTADAAEARAFGVYLSSFLGRRRLAVVTRSVGQDDMARMIAAQAAVRRVSVKVFQEDQEAQTWLCSVDTR